MSRLSIYYGHIRYAETYPGQESFFRAGKFPIRDAVTAAPSVERYGHNWVLGKLDVDDEAQLVDGRLGYPETEEVTQQDYVAEEHRFVERQYSLPDAASSAFVLNYATGTVAFEGGRKIRPTGFINHLVALLNNTGLGEFHGELVRVAADYREFLRNVDKVTRIAFEVRPTNPRDREIFRPLDKGMKAGNAKRERVVIENNDEGLTVDPPGSYDEPNPNPAVQGIAMVEEGYGDGYRIDAEVHGQAVRYDSKTGGLLTDVLEEAPDDPQERLIILRTGLAGRAEQLQPGHEDAAPLKIDDERDTGDDEWPDAE